MITPGLRRRIRQCALPRRHRLPDLASWRSTATPGPPPLRPTRVVILFSRFFLGSLPDRVHPKITYYTGLVFMALGLLILATGPPPIIAIGAAAILGFGFSFPWSSVAVDGAPANVGSGTRLRDRNSGRVLRSVCRASVRSQPEPCRTISAMGRRSGWRPHRSG